MIEPSTPRMISRPTLEPIELPRLYGIAGVGGSGPASVFAAPSKQGGVSAGK